MCGARHKFMCYLQFSCPRPAQHGRPCDQATWPYGPGVAICLPVWHVPVLHACFSEQSAAHRPLARFATCLLNHVAYRLLPDSEERRVAASESRENSRANRAGGRPLSYARGRTVPLHGPSRPLFVPADRDLRSTNKSLAAALATGLVLPVPTRSIGTGITRLIA